MSYKIISKFSNELSEKEWIEMRDSFNLIFEKNNSIIFFKKKYSDCSLGYSSHGILYFNGKIVGCFTIIPRDYLLFNKKEIIGLACDAYILKDHRSDEVFLKNMSEEAISKIKKKNVTKFISLPNPMAYKYWKFLSNWKDIGELDYFVFPVNYTKLIFNYSILPFLSFCVSLIISYIFKLLFIFSNNSNKKNIFIDLNEFSRIQRFNSDNYCYVRLDNGSWGYYRIYKEDDLNVAYIIYINYLSKKNISTMVNKIIYENGCKIDLIAYVGNLKIKPLSLFKLPKHKYPRKLIFTGLILDNFNRSHNIDFFDLNNWEVNLVNFDNR